MRRRIVAVCLILALLVVPVVVYSQAVPAVAIWGVTTAGAAWTAASELLLTVRAALAAPAFYSAATWLTSTLPAAAASIAVPMACVAGATIAGSAAAWALAHGWAWFEGTFITDPGTTGWVPSGTVPVGPLSSVYGSVTKTVVLYDTSANAYAAALAHGGYYWSGAVCATVSGWNCSWGWSGYYCKNSSTSYTMFAYHSPGAVVPAGGTVATSQQVIDAVVDDLTGQDANKKDLAKQLVQASTAAVADTFNKAKQKNTWPPPALPGQTTIPQEMWDAWEKALEDGISQTDQDAMKAQDTPENYGKDATNLPLQTVGTTAPAMTNVNVNVQFPEFPVPDPPPPVSLGDDPDPPDKMSLTSILQDYTDNLETLPIVGIVSGAHLEISGADPLLDLPVTIPPNPPVNVRIDFSKYESIVDTLGTLMLTYVSIIWTVWLFKGRGDA